MNILDRQFLPPLAGNILFAMMSALIGYLWNAVKTERRLQRNTRDGLCTVLYIHLRKIYTDAMKAGCITFTQLSDAERVYNSYHDLGGNGVGTTLINEMRGMKIVGK